MADSTASSEGITMKRRRTRHALANPFDIWLQLALRANETLVASAQVIHHRSNRIAMASAIPSKRDQREFTLMGQEKIEAVNESAQALAARMVTNHTQFGALVFRQLLKSLNGIMTLAASPELALSAKGQAALLRDAISNSSTVASQLSGSVARLAQHGLRPIHSRATGNARRLLDL
jgi:hypothetical protein